MQPANGVPRADLQRRDLDRPVTREVLIIGASARAAAHSAIRAGWHPFAIDQFADEDLLACCPAKRANDYPRAIAALAHQFPHCPVLYTGALENHPEVITALKRNRPLLGNDAEVVRAVRDPWNLREKLLEGRLPAPSLCRANEACQPGDWLLKPRRSGGGIGIQRIDSQGEDLGSRLSSLQASHYRQQFVPGVSISSLYVGASGNATLLGVTTQLIGCAWAGAAQFFYAGNVGPRVVSQVVVEQFQRIGDILAREFQLQGLFGVDAILRDDEVWTLEVNPRYTAAVEVLERNADLPAFRWHVEACEQQRLPTIPRLDGAAHGKAVLYARCSLVVPAEFSQWVASVNSDAALPIVADLPAAGLALARGRPVCTIFATAASEAAVITALQALAGEALSILEIGQSHGR